MRGITLKIMLSVSSLIIIAIVGITLLSSHKMAGMFHEYMAYSIEINDPFPYKQGGKIVEGPAEKGFIRAVYIELIGIGIPIMLLSFVVGGIIARRTMRPIRRLNDGVAEIAKGNFGHKVNVATKDEIGQLAGSFNRMADELQKAQELRKQFFADAAHELKTPVAVLKGNIEGVLDGVIAPDNTMMTSMLEEVDHLTNMINDIKYLSMADSGQLILNRERVDINEIVSGCVKQLTAPAKIRNLYLSCHLSESPMFASVDREKMHQVIYNLLINAGKYTPAGGSVSVTTERVTEDGEEKIKVSIKDTGIGIDAPDLPYVFERFYRSDKSRDRKTGGIGLGLSIVKKIVDLHGGHVGVESELHKGSIFYVVVPAEKV